MAITEFFRCEILVNGQPLPEFDDGGEDGGKPAQLDGNPSKVVKYVQAAPGQEFSIKYGLRSKKLPWNDGLSFDLNLDGKSILDRVYSESKVQPGASWVQGGVKDCEGKHWYEKKFKFADLVTSKASPLDFVYVCRSSFCRSWIYRRR